MDEGQQGEHEEDAEHHEDDHHAASMYGLPTNPPGGPRVAGDASDLSFPGHHFTRSDLGFLVR